MMLTVNNLTGFGVEGSVPLAATHLITRTTTNNATGYAYYNTSLGKVPERLVLAIVGTSSAASRSISSVTVDGVAATFVAGVGGAALNLPRTEIWEFSPCTNSTVDILVTYNASMNNSALSAYEVSGASGGAVESATANANVSSLSTGSLTTNSGVAIAVVSNGSSTSTSFTWTNIVEEYDFYDGEHTTSNGANQEYVAGTTITATQGFSSVLALVMGIWR